MADLTLIHTAEVHVATFAALAPEADLCHVVRPDWLARAQTGIGADLTAEISAEFKAVTGPVLCTCTTLGPTVEAMGATRVDWPMMQIAAQHAITAQKPVLMAYCLASTAEPSSALLRRAFGERHADITELALPQHWPLFEAGNSTAFCAALAESIAIELAQNDYACVVLAQASMAGTAAILAQQVALPVLASPQIAMQALLAPQILG
ncbi:hypothetical protein PH5382_02119 [Phaeobacter sp. CECT 5382]|uniref:hypothetical protein n=1 Tax=Phaeobacter sp. CECT 5382 TaxID=1712645 RepID=UPI0006DAD1E7|nr:hypothetical protein [Phaeobacter sp. CECT 5382]CUH88187.1 hypothetical protein PH5382_02119 [Phaeobacter sp. CECT 5382]